MKTILVTGGAGYIGSHTIVELLRHGFDVVSLDCFCGGQADTYDRVEQITGRRFRHFNVDLRDREHLFSVLQDTPVDAVIHFAGYKAVGESLTIPLEYYENNLVSSINLLQACQKYAIHSFVFSSSAAVYGNPGELPLREHHPVSALNPYGRTKIMMEDMLRDLHFASPEFRISILRYFNPVGAHPSGLIGESPAGTPTNLMPLICRAASRKDAPLRIFGQDYDTTDGSAVRDFIHVMDLASGHVAALEHLAASEGLHVHNLGTGKGISVLEMVDCFEKVNGVEVPRIMAPRREGDAPACWAATDKAEEELGWCAERTLEDMVRDSWNWTRRSQQG